MTKVYAAGIEKLCLKLYKQLFHICQPTNFNLLLNSCWRQRCHCMQRFLLPHYVALAVCWVACCCRCCVLQMTHHFACVGKFILCESRRRTTRYGQCTKVAATIHIYVFLMSVDISGRLANPIVTGMHAHRSVRQFGECFSSVICLFLCICEDKFTSQSI